MQKTICLHCEKERPANIMHQCKFCDGTYCISHRIPERHDCAAVMKRKYVTMGTEVHEEESRKMSEAYARAKQINESRKKRLREKEEEDEEEAGLVAWLRKVLGFRK